MTESFKEKLRSISFPRKLGQSEKVPVINDDNGKIAGHHTVHWDGKQDANAYLSPIAVKAKTREELDE